MMRRPFSLVRQNKSCVNVLDPFLCFPAPCVLCVRSSLYVCALLSLLAGRRQCRVIL